MNHSLSHKKQHTGKNLVLLNYGLTGDRLFKAAKRSSMKLAHFGDYHLHPELYGRAFTEGDGIFFESLKVAVINFEKEDQIDFLNAILSGNAVLVTEPERYVYKIGRVNPVLYKRAFPDTKKSSWGIKVVGAEHSAFSGKGVNIAILDTGLFKEHNDLRGRKIRTKKFVSSGISGDADGHGTHCVGIACGFADSEGLRYGVAYDSNIFCGKVLDDNGEGTDSGILAGMEWAISQKCRIISMSLGAPSGIDDAYSEIYETIAQRAMKMGSLIIAAAGNESNRPFHVAPVGHPANCPSIMAVGALDSNLKIAPFSCGGINNNGGQVDIVAPGVAVYSMVNVQNGHEKWDGTSMATPFVTGLAGLFFEQNPESTPLEIWTMLTQHARRLDISSADAGSGLAQAPENNTE